MKKLVKNLCLLLAIGILFVPTFTFAEEENPTSTPTESPSPSATPTPSQTPPTSSDATLSALGAESIDLNKAFSSSVHEYTATVTSSVISTTITATANDSKATITGLGAKSLNVGVNTFEVVVTAENGNKVTYTIKITRATDNLNLTLLNIQGQRLNETFDPTKTEYTANITYNVSSITVGTGKPDGTTVTINGNSNLNVGKNTVTVTVTNAAGEKKVYTIIVTRGTEEELNGETGNENSNEISDDTTTSDITSDVVSDTVIPVKDNSDNSNSNDTMQYVIVVIACIVLLIIAIIGIVFFVRSGDSDKKREKKIAKLKKKQFKIEEQLTGLMPVITEEEEREYLQKKDNSSKNEGDKQQEILDKEEVEEKTVDLSDDKGAFAIEEINFEDTIEMDPVPDKPKRRIDRNINDDFDDLF